MTSTKAAKVVGISRPHVSSIRNELEKRGCIQRRTISGNAQGYVERQLSAAQTTGGTPIGATGPFEASHAAEHYGLIRLVTWPALPPGALVPQAIGSVCYPGMRAA
jgi:DNA-binding Lrp family transcriptional regulator